MTYALQVLRDNPIGFWPLDETTGTTAYDSSGCDNHGQYVGGLVTGLMPLVGNGIHASSITNSKYITLPTTKDYYGATAPGGFANKNVSDNDFSLEVWIYPKFVNSNTGEVPILADSSSGVGLFWQNGNIVFKLSNTVNVKYTVPFPKKSLHVVAVYGVSYASIYVDGSLAAQKDLIGFKFSNNSISLAIGPTLSGDEFLVDGPAVYRYTLPAYKVREHYEHLICTPPIQIVQPDGGTLFSFVDVGLKKAFTYSYPANKNWTSFYNEDLIYDQVYNYIEVKPSDNQVAKTIQIDDVFTIPLGANIQSSIVEWFGDNGVSVQVSVDGTPGSYQTCTNGAPIPQFKRGTSFNASGAVYVRIILSTSDASKYLPRLYGLDFKFYTSKVIFADNNGDYIESEQPLAGSIDLTSWDVEVGSKNFAQLLRHYNNGIRSDAAGFALNTQSSVRTIEMLFSPVSLAASTLFHHPSAHLSWDGSGTISKSGISAIYVNDINHSSATNISSFFKSGEMYHVVIVLSSGITSKIWFNVKVNSNTWTEGGPKNLYNNIAIYPQAFAVGDVNTHWTLYIASQDAYPNDNAFAVTESEVSVYNYDWKVVSSI